MDSSVKMDIETGTDTPLSAGSGTARSNQARSSTRSIDAKSFDGKSVSNQGINGQGINNHLIHPTGNPPKEVILDAAQRLLVRNGYAGLSMRELSRHSGLAKGTIYYHFTDKQAIYLSVLERDMQMMAERIQAAATGEGTCIERLRCVVETYFEIVRGNCSLLITRLREISGMEEQLRHLVNQYRHELFQPVIDLLHEGMDAGYIRRIDSQMAVLSLFGMMNSFVTHALLLEQATITPAAVLHTLELFLCAIASDTFDAVAYLHGNPADADSTTRSSKI